MAGWLDKPILSEDDAAALIRDHDTVAIGGSGAGNAIPEAALRALGKRFRTSGEPRGLTLVHAFGVGDMKARGLEHVADATLVRRVVGGHWLLSPSMARLAAEDRIEAYCLPAGVIIQLFHAAAAGSPGYTTEIGAGTFVDPRVEGGRLNQVTNEQIVEIARRHGREYLFYPTIPIDVALIKGHEADTEGNISMEGEIAPWHNLAMAQAARANCGRVIAQVRRVVPAGTLDPRRVRVPGIFVDCLVVDAEHGMSYGIDYDATLSGEARRPDTAFDDFPFSLRKCIARRAAMELRPNAVINVGFGMPDGVMKVAREQGLAGRFVPTIEQGPVGGIPADGLEFGASYNAAAIIETGQMMSFYHGTGVDITFLGFVEVDRRGDVNVSRMPHAIIGTGGFIDISQKARKVVFCGTLAVKGEFEAAGGTLTLRKQGAPKFVERVLQITFSGERARRGEQEVLFVTEAAVFRLGAEGVLLEEIAPGLDLERDIVPQLGFRPLIREPLREMPREIFADERMPDTLFRGFGQAAGA